MSSELERRTAIIVVLRYSRAPKEIIDFFKFPKATVYSIAKSFKESEDIEDVTQMRSLSLEEPSSQPEFMSWRSCPARETSCILTSLPKSKMATRRSTWTSCRLW
ncbi:Uncharacterized protein FKW44_006828 [Caligus rogercresseyi]|uniref:Uncharacterized protein n=1 Tax=Caligus rogercresseyi TaxID=217165 RepID=A0A7T8QT60_CALRO|nr:Uncharacterized protein FKW44_006828 [Caligus rogercresseyi]